jgi:hypothetical protein
MTQLQSILTSPALWVVLGALLLPVTWPLLLLLLPVGGILLLSMNSRKSADGELKAAASEVGSTVLMYFSAVALG